MMELISREEAMERIRAIKEVMLTNGEVINALYHTPTIESRPKGKWIMDEYGIPHCSECNCINNTIHRNYCSNCGAEMREGK